MTHENTRMRRHMQDSSICPFCGFEGAEGGPVEISVIHADQQCSCLHCDREWTDRYTLSETT
jgi:hypothetical protein